MTVREQILKDAKFNTENDERKDREVVEGYTDEIGQVWTKLNSIDDILDLRDELSEEAYCAALAQKRDIEEEIKGGITFGFYYKDGKLHFER